MATFDRTYGLARPDSGSRVQRDLHLDWSALFGGSLIGWGTMLLLSMVAMIVGLAAIDPFAVRPAASNAGAAIWGGASAVIASFVGAFAVVRLAGDRRRGESLMHGAVSWGMSMLLAGLIALFASGVPFGDELRPRRRSMNGHHHPDLIAHEADVRRDETTIIPPTH